MVNTKLWRPANLVVAATLLLATILPLLNPQLVSAYGLVTSRSIQLSSSLASATSVTYKVKYTAYTSHTVKGIVVDFCSNTPIIGDTCTAPAGFTVGTPTVTLVSGITQAGFASGAASANTGRTLTLSDTTGDAMVAGVTVVEFDLTTATNPSTANATFYAKIFTYSNASGANSPDTYTGTANGSNVTGVIDAGGVALSTANQLTVTSKVQERLTFCVYTGANCAAGGSSITLGDTNGVLDPAGPYVDKTGKYDVASNASGNVAIRVKGDTLKTGAFSILEIGNTAASSTTGAEQFGFCTYQASGSGLSPSSPYDNANCNTTTQSAGTGTTGGNGTAQFAFDVANTNTTYGQTFASKVPGTTSQGILAFIGNISSTTEAGIYQTTLTFIATGTY